MTGAGRKGKEKAGWKIGIARHGKELARAEMLRRRQNQRNWCAWQILLAVATS